MAEGRSTGQAADGFNGGTRLWSRGAWRNVIRPNEIKETGGVPGKRKPKKEKGGRKTQHDRGERVRGQPKKKTTIAVERANVESYGNDLAGQFVRSKKGEKKKRTRLITWTEEARVDWKL